MAETQIAWDGGPGPDSHRSLPMSFMPAQPLIINSPLERLSPSGMKQCGVLDWLSHWENQGNQIIPRRGKHPLHIG